MNAPREGRWAAKPLRTRIGFTAIQCGSTIVYGAVLIHHLLTHPHLRRVPLSIASLQPGLIVILGLAYWINETRIRRRTREDAALSERPEGLEEFLVELSIHGGAFSVGSDRGVVYFDRGLLGFVGSRTSFLLAEGDLKRPQGLVVTEWDRPYMPIGLNVEDEGASVTIRPLLGQGRAYRRALRRFLKAREATDADRQWPPLVAWSKEPSTEEKPAESPRLPNPEAAELLERAELALRLGRLGESPSLQDEALGTTRHNRA